MEIRKYKQTYPEVTKHLKEIGVLTRWPTQSTAAIEYDDGIDIVYQLKNLTPSRFAEVADFLLLAAREECKRYEDVGNLFFTSITVKLNRNAKGLSRVGPLRVYTASKHRNPEIMIYGEEALGYELPHGVKKPFLTDRVKEILGIPDSESPGAYTKKKKPYTVVKMVISIRAGLNRFLKR